MAIQKKLDSNIVGLRYAEELGGFKILTGSEVWRPLEPNSYSSFSGPVTTVARNPINADRQRKKGIVVDLDATAGFNTDLTQENSQDLMQGFLFADFRSKVEAPITAVDAAGDEFQAASGLGVFTVNDLVVAKGVSLSGGNTGVHVVTSVSGTAVGVSSALADETVSATLVQVGHQAASGDIDVDVTGAFPAITSTTLDFTTLGLVVGETPYIGGDSAAFRFANAVNNGRKRIRSIAANRIEFDKSSQPMVTETGTGLTIQLFMGRFLKNEVGQLIKRRTYAFERTLGAPDTDFPAQIQSEYILGAVANELVFNMPLSEKITMDFGFIAADHEPVDSVTGVKAGTRPALLESDAFNSTSDVPGGVRIAQVVPGNESPAPLFGFLTDMTLTISNNASMAKAIGTLGAFEVVVGDFMVSGSTTGYFSDVAAVTAVRNNVDVTLDWLMFKNNAGIHFDIPLIALGDGSVTVEQDQAIKVPVSYEAAGGAEIDAALNYTLGVTFFDFLPSLASSVS